jgi:hypothetical protein
LLPSGISGPKASTPASLSRNLLKNLPNKIPE